MTARPRVRGLHNSRPCEIDDDELFALVEDRTGVEYAYENLGSLYRREGGYRLLDFATFDGSGVLEGITIRNRP